MALAVAGACATLFVPALAQEVPPPTTAGASQPAAAAPANTVIVTGIRAAMQSTIDMKRNADGIVDGIVADDIGKFPDTNLAEAVQRISGVSIDRSRGEGSRVTVRGVGPDFNLVLLNGRQMPAANLEDRGSRSFDFGNLASEAVSRIQVYKSARADSPPGGIGATLNIMTGRPLELGNQASIGGKLVYDKSNTNLPDQLNGKKVTPEVSALISRRFGTGDMFGLSLTASYQSRNSGFNQAQVGGWIGPFQAGTTDGYGAIAPGTATNAPTSGIYLTPQSLSYSLTGSQRQRTNGQLTFQFRPTRDWTSTLDYTYARNKIQTLGTSVGVWWSHAQNQRSDWVTGPVSSPSYYEEQSVMQDLASVAQDYATVSTLKSTGFNTFFRANARLRLSLDLHHSVASSGSDSPFGSLNDITTASFGRNTNGADFTHELPVLYMDYTPIGNEVTGSWFQDARSRQVIDQAQAGAKLDIGESSGLNFGLSVTRTRYNSAWQQVQQDAWQGTAPGGHQNAATVYDQSYWTPANLRDYFGQLDGSDDPKMWTTIPVVDFVKVRQNAIDVTGNAAMFTPSLAAPTEVRALREKSSALYVQFNTEWDTAMPMHTGIGLRYERTKVDTDATVADPSLVRWVAQNEYPVTSTPGTLRTEHGDYHNWLPTVDWDMDVLPTLKVRASYGVTIGRPRWDQIQGGATYGAVAGVTGLNVTRGNPRLSPVKSRNLDLSAEWYYTRQSMVSLGLFHKDLSGYAGQASFVEASGTATTPVGGKYWNAAVAAGCKPADTDCLRNYILRNFDGQPGVTMTGSTGTGNAAGVITGIPGDPALPYNVTTYISQNKSSLKGAEVNWQHMFGNGFGVQANYTYVKSDLRYNDTGVGAQFALLGLSDSANLVGIYEDRKLSVRLAYNWRDRFLASVAESGRANPVYVEPYGQFDLSVGYNVTDRLSLALEAINLADATQRAHGRTVMQVLSVSTGGPRYMVGARYKF
ncbi:TonB-dependent receptor [Pseudoduganella albidiflava]|nr:TonB-dependent receptor [Pseudoduganella albidiflava]